MATTLHIVWGDPADAVEERLAPGTFPGLNPVTGKRGTLSKVVQMLVRRQG